MSNGVFTVAAIVGISLILTRLVAHRVRVPTTTLLVLCGVAAGILLPTLPEVDLDPHLVLSVFLPPLIYHHAAFGSAPREIRADLGPILVLGVGLTAVTTTVVGFVAWALLSGVGVGLALALGAALAPTAAVPTCALLRRHRAPARVITILEGESLVNEGVALVLFALALEWNNDRSHVLNDLVSSAGELAGGALLGLAIAWLLIRLRRRITDPGTLILISLATPFIAHHTGELLHASGPVATAAAGIYAATRTGPDLHTPGRVTERLTWRVLVFLLGGTLAVLLGIQLRDLPEPGVVVLIASAAIILVVIACRVAWSLLAAPAARWIPGGSPAAGHLPRTARLTVALGATQGPLALAIALALPSAVAERDAVLTIVAIAALFSGLVQIPALTLLVRRLFPAVPGPPQHEEVLARTAVSDAAIRHLDEAAEDDRFDRQVLALQRAALRVDRVLVRDADQRRALHRELIQTEREELMRLYRAGEISSETLHSLTHELDLQDPDASRAPEP
ncbi:cation:proton antiporter [Actinomadura barringtoniae]|uniref:Cation:proton antiporter n=1 Tax=Actinomadura barringtoniae TaxID=1427535 RepID=A0A939TGU6_9ACTN|nr:cation:proton antiporter [Actinomadura barringtoniae]MBO2455785.1 cation:proton antiporter [Actinomadura barringtoniae]